MNFKSVTSLSVCVILSNVLVSNMALASYPYEGSVPDCKVNSPISSGLDAGSLVDRNCNTIFVLPPKKGVAAISSYNLTGMSELCASYTYNRDFLIKLNEKKNQIATQLLILPTEELQSQYKLVTEMLNDIKQELYESGETVGLVGKMYFETNWAKLVDQYKVANQDMDVKRIPVVASIFSIETKKRDPLLRSTEHATDGLYELTIPGVNFSKFSKLSEIIGYENDLEESKFSFGNSLSGTVKLNFHGMCALKDVLALGQNYTSLDQLNVDAAKKTIDSYMAANLNIWYPVQLQKSFKLELSVEQVTDVIHKFLKNNSTFKFEEFVDAVENSHLNKIVKITIDNETLDLESLTQGTELSVMVEKIMDDLLTRVLSHFANRVGPRTLVKLDVPPDAHIMQPYNVTHCSTHRSWFKKRTHCWQEQLERKVSVDGIAKLKSKKRFK